MNPGDILKSSLLKKVIVYIIVTVVVSVVMSKVGFPPLFVVIFDVYIFACFLFYIIIDLPAMKKQTGIRTFVNIVFTFALFSAIYTGVTAFLPQFDPEYERAALRQPPLSLASLAGPEVIKAGEEVFNNNKCANCHKFKGMGTSMRGPNFDLVQIGLYDRDWLIENIVDPRKEASMGFEDQKSKNAMPIYFGEDISEDEMGALIAYLQTGWNGEQMPMIGKEDVGMVRWDEDPEMLALAKRTFFGKEYKDLNCSTCHGKDGIPTDDETKDLRDPDGESERPGRKGQKLKDWSDADWFDSVANGVDDSEMEPWLELYPPRAIWLGIIYAKQFSKGGMAASSEEGQVDEEE
ncbi:MAG: c-type cytochrome [Candidatus Hydrothermarchaeaceae archaeon]